jgi:hypothetical protein
VYETAEDLDKLQVLMDRSIENAGVHLRTIFRPPDHSLSARQLSTFFRGKRQVALATVTARGEPRVSPIDALLVRGKFHFGTSIRAVRIRHLRQRPAVSLAYFEADDVAIVVHGIGALIEFEHPDFVTIDREFVANYGGTPSTREEGSIYVRVEPTHFFTFARYPERFPDLTSGDHREASSLTPR